MSGGSTDKVYTSRILVVRLGAMGDIIHALPAVAALKQGFPEAHLTWAVDPKWVPLLEGNPSVDDPLLVRRSSRADIFESWRNLRSRRYDFAVDFQGLIKSALTARLAGPGRIYGFHRTQVRERIAAWFYSDEILSTSAHMVDRNLDLAVAAGAARVPHQFPIPPGEPEGDLPLGEFVLASPVAGWPSKQWPREHYTALAQRLQRDFGLPLVLNMPQSSSLSGLIYATRRATAVIGVDSGPMHLAAALGKPGVAIFGPTDPARNGPYGDSFRVLRTPGAVTTYKRGRLID